MVGRIRYSKDNHVLISGVCDYVTLYVKRKFTDMINVRILRQDYPRLSGWALHVIISIFIRGKQRELEQQKKAM